MAKQGQHHGDSRDSDISRGPNEHGKAIPITTGTYKKKSTYRKQAAEHQATDKQPQDAEPKWLASTHRTALGTRARRPRSGRSGSDSNADSGTRGH